MRLLGMIALTLLAACAAPITGGTFAPANPQPDPAALRPGLAVAYAYPADIRTLRDARKLRGRAQPGPPLPALNFRDTARGENALTSRQPERVAAFVEGYVRVDAPGPHGLQFWSNDGLEVTIGGAPVHFHDGRHTCQTKGWGTFNAPAAGWYKLEAVYFQRLNTSCLIMNWRPPGGSEGPTPAANFAHLPG